MRLGHKMTIETKVRGYILNNYLFTDDDAALGNDDSFLERGIVDSTGIMELIFFLEQEFGVRIDDEDMVPENLDSVSRIAAFIGRKRAAA